MKYFFSLLIFSALIYVEGAKAQSTVGGVVVSKEDGLPIEGVAVTSKLLRSGVLTDYKGRYTLSVAGNGTITDTIQFSYLGYKEQKFPIHNGWNTFYSISVSLEILPTNLKTLNYLGTRNFQNDSIQNRVDNAYLFNYKRPTVLTSILHTPLISQDYGGAQFGTGLGFNISSFYEGYLNGHYRRLRRFQKNLYLKEKQTFIHNYFNSQNVHQITGMEGEELKSFMKRYEPKFKSLLGKSEYDIKLQIRESYQRYKNKLESKVKMK